MLLFLRRYGLPLLLLAGCSRSASAPAQWDVSIRGYGPVEAGMTLTQAESAGHKPITHPKSDQAECDMVAFAADSTQGIEFLVERGTIERVDILDSTIATNHGARVGSTEAAVESLYPGRVTVQPHKYDEAGHYLVIGPKPEDSLFALVFETDGHRVTRYRAGRRPAVEYVEGCA